MNYLLYGNETYNLNKRRKEIINDLIGDDTLNLSVFSSADYSIQDVIDDCETVPFLASDKVVILENPRFLISSKKEGEEELNKLVEYLKDPNPITSLIIYADKDFDRRITAVKTLVKYMRREVYDLLAEEEFRAQVNKDLKANNLILDIKSLNELFDRLPLDLGNWNMELEKLLLYPDKIDRDVIKKLVARPLENDVFQLSNAVTDKDLNRAIGIYHDLMVNNKNQVKSLIGLLAYQFRFMCLCRTLNEQGYTIPQIATRLDAKEYRIRMSLKNSAGTNSKRLLEILDKLSRLDQDVLNGRVDPQLGLELFIIEATRR